MTVTSTGLVHGGRAVENTLIVAEMSIENGVVSRSCGKGAGVVSRTFEAVILRGVAVTRDAMSQTDIASIARAVVAAGTECT